MNHYILIAILLIICILIGVYIYKLDLQNSNIQIQNSISLEKQTNDIPSDIDTITSDNSGNVHIFKNNKYWKLIDGEIDINNNDIEINKIWNIPKEWNNIDVATWDNVNNTLVFIKNNTAYPLKDNLVGTGYPLYEYWSGLSNKDINYESILYLNNTILFIKNEKYLEYDIVNNKKLKSGKLNDKFNGLDFKKINGVFLNNDHILNQPSGSIVFVKGNKYYKYNLIENKIDPNGTYFNTGLVKPDYIEYNFNTLGKTGVFPPKNIDNVKYNDKLVSIKDGIQSWVVPREANYRIICYGAGKPNGGFGSKVFNDLKLKKGDKVDVLVGQSGINLPIANISNDTKLNKMGSSSGSGASYVWINDKLSLVSGGGGGWSSEIHPCPESCNSLKYDDNTVPSNGKIHIPIKKILITCENKNNSSKIILNKVNIDSNFNKINIKESPQVYDLNNKNFLGETQYSRTPPVIEIDFEDYLTDYNIDLDYDIMSNNTNGEKSILNDIVKVYDIEGDVYTIYNFNKKYNGMGLNANLLLTEKLGYIPKCVERNNQMINDDLAKCGGDIGNIHKQQQSIIKNQSKNTVVLNGGFGGGGASSANKSNLNMCYCGGGGGFMGGNSGVSTITEDINGNKYNYRTIKENVIEIDNKNNKVRVKLPFVSGSGGSSFVSSSNIDSVLMNEEDYKANWCNKFNSKNGFVKIILLKDLHKKIEPENTEEYISKTYNVIKKNSLETPLQDIELKLVDTIVSTNKNKMVSGISSINDIDNSYNVKSFDLVVKPKDIDTSSCSTMANVSINPNLYNEEMPNRNTNPIVDKSFYKTSSLRGICDNKITVIKFPISNRINLRNVKINIDLESDDKISFSGMFNYIFVKENSILRYMAYLNRPEEDIIPENLLSFNVSRERCEQMKNKEILFEEMSKLNIAGFSNNLKWENVKNTIETNIKKYPKYLQNDPNFNLVFDKTNKEDKIFDFTNNYKANIKTKWNTVEPGFLYILLNNNNNNSDVYYNISFVEYDPNGVSTFDYLKTLEASNILSGKEALKEIKNKRDYINYQINKQIEDIMNN